MDRWSKALTSVVFGGIGVCTSGCSTEQARSVDKEEVVVVEQAHSYGNFDCQENSDCGCSGGSCHGDGSGGTMCSCPPSPPPTSPSECTHCWDGHCYRDYCAPGS